MGRNVQRQRAFPWQVRSARPVEARVVVTRRAGHCFRRLALFFPHINWGRGSIGPQLFSLEIENEGAWGEK